MFEGLDEIGWADLEHAYGPAADVPGLIRDLTSSDAAVADAATDALFGNIWHQGTVYPASVPAVPFLAEALDHVPSDRQAQVLELLAEMARGHGYYDVHQHSEPLGAQITATLDDPAATISAERAVVRATTLAVFAEWDRIEVLLGAPHPAVRFAALHALAVLARNDATEPTPEAAAEPHLGVRPDGGAKGAFAARLMRRAEAALATAPDPAERAHWLSALMQMGVVEHPALGLLALAENDPPLVRFVILQATVITALKTAPVLPDDLAPQIARLIAEEDALAAELEGQHWPWGGDVRGTLLLFAARLSDAAIERFAPTLARLVTPDISLLFRGEAALALVLGRPVPRIPQDPCRLSPGRRAMALRFLERPRVPTNWWFWDKMNGNAAGACRAAGVPHDRAVWLKWLGVRRRFFGLLPPG